MLSGGNQKDENSLKRFLTPYQYSTLPLSIKHLHLSAGDIFIHLYVGNWLMKLLCTNPHMKCILNIYLSTKDDTKPKLYMHVFLAENQKGVNTL